MAARAQGRHVDHKPVYRLYREEDLQLRFIAPGKPVLHTFVERLNGRFRDECLNEYWFVNLEDAR